MKKRMDEHNQQEAKINAAYAKINEDAKIPKPATIQPNTPAATISQPSMFKPIFNAFKSTPWVVPDVLSVALWKILEPRFSAEGAKAYIEELRETYDEGDTIKWTKSFPKHIPEFLKPSNDERAMEKEWDNTIIENPSDAGIKKCLGLYPTTPVTNRGIDRIPMPEDFLVVNNDAQPNQIRKWKIINKAHANEYNAQAVQNLQGGSRKKSKGPKRSRRSKRPKRTRRSKRISRTI
jgi:hypothetical protein